MALITLNNNSLSSVTSLPAGVGGKVLQVVTATDSTSRSTTSTSYTLASSSLTANITPSATSSKIYVIITGGMYINTNNKRGYITIFRDSTNLAGADGMAQVFASTASPLVPFAVSILDSPSSTAQINYQIRIKTNSGSTFYINEYLSKSSITLYEIGA